MLVFCFMVVFWFESRACCSCLAALILARAENSTEQTPSVSPKPRPYRRADHTSNTRHELADHAGGARSCGRKRRTRRVQRSRTSIFFWGSYFLQGVCVCVPKVFFFFFQDVPEEVWKNLAEELRQPRIIPRRLDQYTAEERAAFPHIWSPPEDFHWQ
uniref:Secreted protein n=1 Tax=Eptatretus burgeri TaxID=7764 RepID=A0A8C4QFW8_EPTBU